MHSDINEKSPADGSPQSRGLLPFLAWIAGAYFLLRVIYFVIVIHHSMPPDETTHLDRVEYFAQFFFLPHGEAGDGNAHLWMSRYHPSLYYLLAGKALLLNIFSFEPLVAARLFNVFLSCLTVAVGWRFVKLISRDPVAHFLFLIMLTNTLMFTFLSATVTYDCLVNLLSALSIYFLVSYVMKHDVRSFLLLLTTLFLGTLTKTTMLPFSFLALVGLAMHERGRLMVLLRDLTHRLGAREGAVLGLAALVSLLVLLNVALYGQNLARFGHLAPRPEQVLDSAEVNFHPIAARKDIYVGFLKGEHSLEEALEMARQIEEPSASLDTENLVRYGAWRREHEGPFQPMSRLAYVFPWAKLMLYSTFGILGHSIVFKSFWGYLPYIAFFGLAAVAFFARVARRRVQSWEVLCLGMFLVYAVILMQAVNYRAYLDFELPHISVQGRYLFPFLVPVYGIAVLSALNWKSARIRSILAILISLCFLYGDFPSYIFGEGNSPW